MRGKNIMTAGILACFLGVAIGAFGAHALGSLLTEKGRTATFETAVKYQFYHGLGLLFVGLLRNKYSSQKLITTAWLFGIGIFVFSGSLYTLCLTDLRIMGAITPLGGTLFLSGWVVLAYFIRTYKSSR